MLHFGDKVFRTVIPRNVRLAEAPSFGKAVLFHDKDSRGALAYLALAGEMIRREEEALAGPAPSSTTKTRAKLTRTLTRALRDLSRCAGEVKAQALTRTSLLSAARRVSPSSSNPFSLRGKGVESA